MQLAGRVWDGVKPTGASQSDPMPKTLSIGKYDQFLDLTWFSLNLKYNKM